MKIITKSKTEFVCFLSITFLMRGLDYHCEWNSKFSHQNIILIVALFLLCKEELLN